MANLQNWVNLARNHWKEFRPKMYAALKQNGELESALQEAASKTFSEVSQLEDAGYQADEAFQMVREKYLILPEEPNNDQLDPETERADRERLQQQADVVRLAFSRGEREFDPYKEVQEAPPKAS